MYGSFEHNLRQTLEPTPDLRRRGKKILAILDDKPSRRRTRRIAAMERHAAAHFGEGRAIDWSKIDWSKIIEVLLPLLLALLKFIMVI